MKSRRIDPDDVDLDYIRNEFGRFRSDIARAKEKLSANASSALDQINSYLNGGSLSSRVANVEAELEGLAGRMRDYSKEGVAKLESNVSDRPIASIAIAFGVGLLAAQFLRR